MLRSSALAVVLGSLVCGTQALAQQSADLDAAPLTNRTLRRIDAIVLESQGLQRAINLARNAATQLNGGLSIYRPASCMYAGISNNPCLIQREAGSFVFRFGGGAPGWEQLRLDPALETEIRISADGRTVLQVIYNGPPQRSSPSS